MNDTPAISAKGLSKTFRVGLRGRRVEALRGLDLTVHRGELYGFLGPNGAGKSTTIKILTSLIFPTSGEARVLGDSPGSAAMKARLGYLPESPVLYEHLTGGELLAYYYDLFSLPRKSRKERVAGLLHTVGLDAHFADRFRAACRHLLAAPSRFDPILKPENPQRNDHINISRPDAEVQHVALQPWLF